MHTINGRTVLLDDLRRERGLSYRGLSLQLSAYTTAPVIAGVVRRWCLPFNDPEFRRPEKIEHRRALFGWSDGRITAASFDPIDQWKRNFSDDDRDPG